MLAGLLAMDIHNSHSRSHSRSQVLAGLLATQGAAMDWREEHALRHRAMYVMMQGMVPASPHMQVCQ